MKTSITTLLFLLSFVQLKAQDKLVKDIDFDGKNDTVYVNIDKSVIVCKLLLNNTNL